MCVGGCERVCVLREPQNAESGSCLGYGRVLLGACVGVRVYVNVTVCARERASSARTTTSTAPAFDARIVFVSITVRLCSSQQPRSATPAARGCSCARTAHTHANSQPKRLTLTPAHTPRAHTHRATVVSTSDRTPLEQTNIPSCATRPSQRL